MDTPRGAMLLGVPYLQRGVLVARQHRDAFVFACGCRHRVVLHVVLHAVPRASGGGACRTALKGQGSVPRGRVLDSGVRLGKRREEACISSR